MKNLPVLLLGCVSFYAGYKFAVIQRRRKDRAIVQELAQRINAWSQEAHRELFGDPTFEQSSTNPANSTPKPRLH